MTDRPVSDPTLIDAVCDLAIAAGAKTLEIYHSDFKVAEKDDASPVTEADQLAEAIILEGLNRVAPDIPVLAEESASEGNTPPDLGNEFFLVDPLDGTKEFIKKTGEFTVNIALIRNNRPVMGVVYAPALNRLYAGDEENGAWVADVADGKTIGERQKISVRTMDEAGLVAVASRSHRSPETDAFLETMNVKEFAAAGSSLKFCLVAEAKADIYPRFGRTMEWDTGAGQAVLEAAGGSVHTHPEDETLTYGKEARGFDNPYFIARGKRA